MKIHVNIVATVAFTTGPFEAASHEEACRMAIEQLIRERGKFSSAADFYSFIVEHFYTNDKAPEGEGWEFEVKEIGSDIQKRVDIAITGDEGFW